MRQPGFAAHFVFQLAGAPSGVPGEDADLLRWREGLADFDECVQRMPDVQVWHHIRVCQERVGMEITQRRGLDRTTEEQRLFAQSFRKIRDHHLADLILRGAVQHEAKRALGIVLAKKNYRAMKEGTVQTASVQEELSFQ